MQETIKVDNYELKIVFDIFDDEEINEKQTKIYNCIINNAKQFITVASTKIVELEEEKRLYSPEAFYICRDDDNNNDHKFAILYRREKGEECHPCVVFNNEEIEMVGYDYLVL